MRNLFILLTYISLSFGQNEVCFTIEENPQPNDPALGLLDKYVNVLDCIHVYGASSVSDEKILHVASIAAELLDNDEDGVVDDQNIFNELNTNYTVMPVFHSENSNLIDQFFDNFNYCAGAILFRQEIDPSQPGQWGDDATVEEVLHTINTCGHVEVYPQLYGLEPSSSYLTQAMDVARGGQFITMPSSYPDEAWYHYDDWTCDYECMAMEYLYWCIVTNMGLLSGDQICQGIANEWELCTPQLFEETDILMHDLVTDIQNLLPQNAPDGNYCPQNNPDELMIGYLRTGLVSFCMDNCSQYYLEDEYGNYISNISNLNGIQNFEYYINRFVEIEGETVQCVECEAFNVISINISNDCENPVSCFGEPCATSTCASIENGTCISNYCGGCYSDYYDNNELIVCGAPNGIIDLSGVDFGLCDMALGVGWVNNSCQYISGCDWIVDGVDYSDAFFSSMDECASASTLSSGPTNTLANKFSVQQNYPNPFNPITKLKYFLPEDGNVEIYIYDLNGKIVKSIMSQYKTAGSHSIIWNSLNNDGNNMPSGIYFCSITFNNISKSIKMAFLK